MFCPNCGAKNPADARFCNQCGTHLKESINDPTEDPDQDSGLESDFPNSTPEDGETEDSALHCLICKTGSMHPTIHSGTFGFGTRKIRSAAGRMVDSETVKLLDGSPDLKPDDVVVVIHAEDYQETFQKMLERISEMDKKVDDQSKILKASAEQEKKGFIGRLRKPKE